MMTALEAIGAAPAEPLEVELALGAFALAGWLENVRPTGLLRYRPAKVKARDRLALWIEHLALCAMDPPGIERSSRLLMLDQDLVYRPVAEPRPVLAQLLELYWKGLSSPLPFFAESSWAYAAAMTGGKGREAALRAAWSRWLDGYAHNGEGGDEYIDTAWRGTQPINEDFESVALRILEPLMGHVGA
jgi:exodeoxyribonuclease V gamma subunit